MKLWLLKNEESARSAEKWGFYFFGRLFFWLLSYVKYQKPISV